MDSIVNSIVAFLESVRLLVKSWYGGAYWYMIHEHKVKHVATWEHFIVTLLKAPAVWLVDYSVHTKLKGIRLAAILGVLYWVALGVFTRFVFLPEPWNAVAIALILLGFVVNIAVDGDYLIGERGTDSYRGYQVFCMWTLGVPFVFAQTILIFVVDSLTNLPEYINAFFDTIVGILSYEIWDISVVCWAVLAVLGGFMGKIAQDTFVLISVIKETGYSPFDIEYAKFLMLIWVVAIVVSWLIAMANDWFGVYLGVLFTILSMMATAYYLGFDYPGVVDASQYGRVAFLAGLWIITGVIWKLVIQESQPVLAQETGFGSYPNFSIPTPKASSVRAMISKVRKAKTNWQ